FPCVYSLYLFLLFPSTTALPISAFSRSSRAAATRITFSFFLPVSIIHFPPVFLKTLPLFSHLRHPARSEDMRPPFPWLLYTFLPFPERRSGCRPFPFSDHPRCLPSGCRSQKSLPLFHTGRSAYTKFQADYKAPALPRPLSQVPTQRRKPPCHTAPARNS